MDFAVEMLETAIEHVHTKEEVEEEHVASVQEAIRRVLEIENIWGNVANLAHHARRRRWCKWPVAHIRYRALWRR